MRKFDYRALKQSTAKSLAQSEYDPKRLILIHSGATLLLTLLLTVADYFLDQQIGTTGGLSGMDRRAVLTSIQSVLHTLQTVLLPFWTLGYTYATVQLAQQETADFSSLLEGFRKWGPALRLFFLQAVLFAGILYFSLQIGFFLFCTTPWAGPVAQFLEENATATVEDLLTMEEEFYAIVYQVRIPLLCISLPVVLLAAAPLFYRFRLARFYLMDHPSEGAIRALSGSARLMRGHYLEMIRLDLHYWWFYGLNLLIAAIGYGSTVVALAGVTLPMSQDSFYLICTAVYAVAQLGLDLWKRNEVSVTYAQVYHLLQQPQNPEESPVPPRQPWTY